MKCLLQSDRSTLRCSRGCKEGGCAPSILKKHIASLSAPEADSCINSARNRVILTRELLERQLYTSPPSIREERPLPNTLDGALERLYLECRQQLFTCALAITRRPDSAEDAIQEAFCRLFRLNKKPRRLKAYVFRAVRNAAVDQIRRSPPPSEPLDTFIFDPGASPREAAADSEFNGKVSQALLSLSEDERETIVQHLFAHITFRDIARIRQSPLGTVVAWYRRGVTKLRKKLEEEQ